MKEPRRRSRHRWEYNIKVYISKIIYEGLDRIKLAQDSAVVDSYECDNEPSRSLKGVEQLLSIL